MLPLLKEITETVQEDSQLLIGQRPEETESFNLCDLIIHNVELLQPVAFHKKLKLSFEIEASVPTHFSGLRNYLDRTLFNLLSNALKFTTSGFVKVKVRLLDETHWGYLNDVRSNIDLIVSLLVIFH